MHINQISYFLLCRPFCVYSTIFVLFSYCIHYYRQYGQGHCWLKKKCTVRFELVQSLSRVRLFATPWTAALQASLFIPIPGVYSDSCPSSWWCHPTNSFSVVPFCSCPQTFPASGSFQMSQLFASGGQSIGVSASASVLPMNTQDWSPLGWTG